MARCAYELKQYSEAECYLSGGDHIRVNGLDEITRDFGDIACFAQQLIAKICQQTERANLANESSRRAIKLNPFLFNSYIDLCSRGEKPDPNQVFQVNTDTFQTSQSAVGHGLNAVMVTPQATDCVTTFDVTTFGTGISNFTAGNGNLTPTILSTPVDQQQPISTIPPTFTTTTPIAIDDTPLQNSENTTSDMQTPFRKQFKYLTAALSPHSPSFGVLVHTPAENITSPMEAVEAQKSNKKIKSQVSSVSINTLKEQPQAKQSPTTVLGQMANIAPKTPAPLTGQNVRRSTRLFSNNYSVKENSKSPNINKFAAPRSPPRKSKQRTKVTTISYELNEKQEKQEKTETNDKVLLNNSINSAQNLAQQVLQMKKQSAEGLMNLLRELGRGYLHLSQYECKEAIQCFSAVSPQHFQSSWVQSMIAVAHHELREYETAVKIFQEIHDREPHRLEMMEIYSTDLWHLQKDVMLSALAQDLMAQDKESPITWCVAGNCFSAHKEHETAIKFFQRAIQVDSDFAYCYTLLGHELVLTEELEKALSCFRTAILKNPRHYNAWFGIGTIYSKQERYQLAEIHYTKALQINPKNSVLMVHIGMMQFFLNRIEQAVQTLNHAIAIDPKNPLCKFHRGSMYFSMGKYQEALRELEELKQIVPKESVVYYLIGKIHKKLGNVDSALMHFSWATDLDPKGANNQIKDNFDSIIRTQDVGAGDLANAPPPPTSATTDGGSEQQSDDESSVGQQSRNYNASGSGIVVSNHSYYDIESP